MQVEYQLDMAEVAVLKSSLHPKYQKLLKLSLRSWKNFLMLRATKDEDVGVNDDITHDEELSVEKELSNYFAGLDDIGYFVFKRFQNSRFSLLSLLFNLCLSRGFFLIISNQIFNKLFKIDIREFLRMRSSDAMLKIF